MRYIRNCIITNSNFYPNDYNEKSGWTTTSRGREQVSTNPHDDLNQAYIQLRQIYVSSPHFHYIIEELP